MLLISYTCVAGRMHPASLLSDIKQITCADSDTLV